jgi:hypothetical protein
LHYCCGQAGKHLYGVALWYANIINAIPVHKPAEMPGQLSYSRAHMANWQVVEAAIYICMIPLCSWVWDHFKSKSSAL